MEGMTAGKMRQEAGCAGALWGFANALIAVFLAATFISGGNDILAGLFLLVAFLPAAIAGAVFGFRGALHYLPLMRPFRLSNAALLKATGLAFGVPAALITAFWLPFNPCIPPSDETLLADFRRNETELNQIARMIKRDKGLRRVDDLVSYRHRLQSMGIGGGHYFPEDDEIQFIIG